MRDWVRQKYVDVANILIKLSLQQTVEIEEVFTQLIVGILDLNKAVLRSSKFVDVDDLRGLSGFGIKLDNIRVIWLNDVELLRVLQDEWLERKQNFEVDDEIVDLDAVELAVVDDYIRTIQSRAERAANNFFLLSCQRVFSFSCFDSRGL